MMSLFSRTDGDIESLYRFWITFPILIFISHLVIPLSHRMFGLIMNEKIKNGKEVFTRKYTRIFYAKW